MIDALAALLDEARYATADELAGVVASTARALGANAAYLYLVDYEQRSLVPLGPATSPARDPLDIDTTMAGRAFRFMEPVVADGGAGSVLWFPLLDGSDRLGVMAVEADDVLAPSAVEDLRLLSHLASALVVSKRSYGDVFSVARRRKDMTLAAELQWTMLPPVYFGSPRVAVAGALEPAYEVGGDAFDYALNGDTLHVAVFDAMGHGLRASSMSTVAVGSYRHSRRQGLDLAETCAAANEVLTEQFGGDRFVTAFLAELDCARGRVTVVNCGHPMPLLIRDNKVVATLDCAPTLPLGLGGPLAELATHQLQPRDRLLFFTDGVIEARSPGGEPFGQERLVDVLIREGSGGQPPPEAVRRLTHAIHDHQGAPLQDDATMLLVEWRGGR